MEAGYSTAALQTDRAAQVVITGHAFVQNLRRGHYELALDTSPALRLSSGISLGPAHPADHSRHEQRDCAGPFVSRARSSATNGASDPRISWAVLVQMNGRSSWLSRIG